jgi:hypothetical protein
MPIYTTPIFVIKVFVKGRKEVIESHGYDSREAAEADLIKITDARQSGFEVDLPWLQMSGALVEAAFVEDQSVASGWIELDMGGDPY